MGRFAHAPAGAAAGHRARVAPDQALHDPTATAAASCVQNPALVRALGDDGGRASDSLAPQLGAHARPPPSRGPGGKQRCLADVNACRAQVISTLWPRLLNGAAGVEIRCGDSVSRSVLWLGRIACRDAHGSVRVYACACACVRARARACVHGAIGVGRGAQNAAGRQALPVFSLRRRAFEILLGLVLQFVVHFFFASVVLNAMKDMHMWRSSSAVSGSRARAHLILRVLFVVLRHVVVRGGNPTRPPLPTHDRQVGVEVSDREKLRQTVAALGASTGANKDMGRCDLRLERSLHLGQGRVFVEGGAAEPDRLCRSREQTRRGGEKHAVDRTLLGGPLSPLTRVSSRPTDR